MIMLMFNLCSLIMSSQLKKKAANSLSSLNEDSETIKGKKIRTCLSVDSGRSSIKNKKRVSFSAQTEEGYFMSDSIEHKNPKVYFKIVKKRVSSYSDRRKIYEVFKKSFDMGHNLVDYEILGNCVEHHLSINIYSSLHPNALFFTIRLRCNCSPLCADCFFDMEILDYLKKNIFLVKRDYDKLEEIERQIFESKTDIEYKKFSDKCCKMFFKILNDAKPDLYYICVEASSLYIFFKKLSETKIFKKYKCLKTLYLLKLIVLNATVDESMRYFYLSSVFLSDAPTSVNQKGAETAFFLKYNILANYFNLLIQCLPNKRKIAYLYTNINILRNFLFSEAQTNDKFFFHSKTALVNILFNIIFLLNKKELQEIIVNFECYRSYVLRYTSSSMVLSFYTTRFSNFYIFHDFPMDVITKYFLEILNFYINRFSTCKAFDQQDFKNWFATVERYKNLIECGLLKSKINMESNYVTELTLKVKESIEICATLYIYNSLDTYRKIIFAEFGIYHISIVRTLVHQH